jgi:hypothetical protein
VEVGVAGVYVKICGECAEMVVAVEKILGWVRRKLR